MLSGGLNAGNVGEALRLANPPGIDISSGVESAPGVKDPALIEAFFRAVAPQRRQRRLTAVARFTFCPEGLKPRQVRKASAQPAVAQDTR